jgi:hypothetical protein
LQAIFVFGDKNSTKIYFYVVKTKRPDKILGYLRASDFERICVKRGAMA